MTQKIKEVGDMIKIEIMKNTRGKPLLVEGRVKEVVKQFGIDSYLVANAKILDDFWVRSFKE